MEMSEERPFLHVGLIGAGKVGAMHSYAWNIAPRVFSLPPIDLELVSAPFGESLTDFAERWGWRRSVNEWREVISDRNIDVIDICTPNDSHGEIAINSLRAGKHVLCEKPLSNTLMTAIEMASAADDAFAGGVLAMLGFNYRRYPAVKFAHDELAGGGLGPVRHISAWFMQSWLADPKYPVTWRLKRSSAGSGVVADLVAHLVDLIRYLTGDEIDSISAAGRCFTPERPGLTPERFQMSTADALSGPTSEILADVDTEECVVAIGTLRGGGLVDIKASRVALPRQVDLGFQIFCRDGSLEFNLRNPNELRISRLGDLGKGVTDRIIHLSQAGHPYMDMWWGAGHNLGADHSHIHQIGDFLRAIYAGHSISPNFHDGVEVQRVIDAIERQIQE